MSTIINKSKRLVALSVAVSMFAWSFGLSGVSFAVAASAGDLIKMRCTNATPPVQPAGCDAVYYLGSDGNRYVFPNSNIYFSWYSDFSTVQEISKTELESYPILIGAASNVTYKPGTKLVKFVTDPKVYAVAKNGNLRHVATEQVAIDIWGANWASMVQDLSDAFGAGYTEGTAINSAGDYSPSAQSAAATSINADKGIGSDPVSGGTGGNLTVSLSPDTPASSIVPENAARVPFTKVNLTASSDGDVTIDQWVIRRVGTGQDGAFGGVDIVDASTNLPLSDVAKTFTSEHKANFTEDFTIPAGTTKAVLITANMAASLDNFSGETPALQLDSVVLKGGGSVVGTLPAVGNPQTLNSTITIGTATIQRGAYTNASVTLQVGRTNYTFFSFSVQAGSAEEVSFSQVRVYQVGSASLSSDVANIKLLEDGTQIATGSVSGLYVNFNFPTITIPKGQTKQFRVNADLTSGSGRTVKLAIYRTTDILVKGSTYNSYITPTYSGTGSAASTKVLTDNQFDVSAGSLRVGRSSTVAATNIAVGNDQVLGAFEFEVKGEPIEITALTLTITSSTSDAPTNTPLQSVRLVDASGSTVAGPTDPTNATLQVRYSDTFTVPVGLNHYKVVGNIATNGGWASDDTINAGINTPASHITARGQNTQLTVTATPSSNVTTATQTVKAASLTVTKNSLPTNKSVITNSTGVLLGSWSFDATNSGEDIRITSLAVRASTTGSINNLTFKDGGTILLPVNDAPTASATATSTFAFNDPVIVSKGTSKTLDLYGDIGSAANAGEVDAWGITSGGAVTAFGVTTGNATSDTVTANDGALLTIAAGGTLTINNDPALLPVRQEIFGTSGVTVANVRLKAQDEDIDITKLIVGVVDGAITGTASGDQDDVSKIVLKKDGAVVGNASGYTMAAATRTINLQRGDLTVPKGDTGVRLTVVADFVSQGTNLPGTPNADVKFGLRGANSFTATGNSSNQTATKTYTNSTGSAIILHRSRPQVQIVTPSNKLGATTVLHTTKITAVGDQIGLYRMTYRLTSSAAAVIVTNGTWKLTTCTGCGGIGDGTQLAGTAANSTYFIDNFAYFTFAVDSTQSHAKAYLQIAEGATATIDLEGTVALTTNSDTVSTVLLGDSATTTTNNTDGATAGNFSVLNQGNFVWSDLHDSDVQGTSGTTATSTTQWYNGHYVEGLGGTPTTTVVTVGE